MSFMDLDHLFEPSLDHSLHNVRPSCVAWDAISEQSWLSNLWRTPAKKQMPTEHQAGLRNSFYTLYTLCFLLWQYTILSSSRCVFCSPV